MSSITVSKPLQSPSCLRAPSLATTVTWRGGFSPVTPKCQIHPVSFLILWSKGSSETPPHLCRGSPGLTSSISSFLARTVAERRSVPAGEDAGGTEQSWRWPSAAWAVEKARKGQVLRRGEGLARLGPNWGCWHPLPARKWSRSALGCWFATLPWVRELPLAPRSTPVLAASPRKPCQQIVLPH